MAKDLRAVTIPTGLTWSGPWLGKIPLIAITVTADEKTKGFGASDPALTYQITSGSLLAGDAFTGALTRVAGSAVGVYQINQGTLGLPAYYTLTYVHAHLTILTVGTFILIPTSVVSNTWHQPGGGTYPATSVVLYADYTSGDHLLRCALDPDTAIYLNTDASPTAIGDLPGGFAITACSITAHFDVQGNRFRAYSQFSEAHEVHWTGNGGPYPATLPTMAALCAEGCGIRADNSGVVGLQLAIEMAINTPPGGYPNVAFRVLGTYSQTE